MEIEKNIKFLGYAIYAFCTYVGLCIINRLAGMLTTFNSLKGVDLIFSLLDDVVGIVYWIVLLLALLIPYLSLKKKNPQFGAFMQAFIFGVGILWIIKLILGIVIVKSFGLGSAISALETIVFLGTIFVFGTLFITNSKMIEQWFNGDTSYKNKLIVKFDKKENPQPQVQNNVPQQPQPVPPIQQSQNNVPQQPMPVQQPQPAPVPPAQVPPQPAQQPVPNQQQSIQYQQQFPQQQNNFQGTNNIQGNNYQQ